MISRMTVGPSFATWATRFVWKIATELERSAPTDLSAAKGVPTISPVGCPRLEGDALRVTARRASEAWPASLSYSACAVALASATMLALAKVLL